MVIQQNVEVKIWGWAQSGETVSVKGSWLQTVKSTVADEKGDWIIKIKSPVAGGPHQITIKGKNEIVIKNVLAGEVWFASGQSNMDMPLKRCKNAESEIQKATFPDIRFFYVEHIYNEKPQINCKGSWVTCTPKSASDFSAVAYYFGRKLYKDLNCPVGLISSSKGGSPAEAWMSTEALKSSSLLSELNTMWNGWEEECPDEGKSSQLQYQQWVIEKKEAEEKGGKEPPKPEISTACDMISKPHRRPGALYNAMVAPLIYFKIKGVIWYQGGNNVDRPKQYRKLFPALIKSWRHDWQQENLPFYYAQQAPYRYKDDLKNASLLREAQTMAMSLPNSGMVVTADIGNIDDIHPKNKLDVGERLALWAISKTYGNDKLVCSGPLFRSIQINNNRIRIYFDYAESGLIKKGKTLSHFEIAGVDQIYYPAIAEIEGSSVIVSSDSVANPVAARYGWWINTIPNLYNREGLPAAPFRTDNWD
jgi:sialate O-acetylesterase